ncbi:hypothetical protein [Flavobacterium agrisoli]|uniref:Uncharacterized protein n=1 Tax=Flavobacterium agrisoli TaxID=2793066 RepID=A0A934PQM5_9FLAO|nr:hypothetical protein [Flavobacterium agrisoli]MBK0371303.1 hypothetical protein [Flavobacterium agrisoli]
MNEIIQKLEDIVNQLEDSISSENNMSIDILIDTKNKLSLYIQKFFNSKAEYTKTLTNINSKPTSRNGFHTSVTEFKSLASTLIQDLQLSMNDFSLITEKEKNELINNARKEIENEKKKIDSEANEIRKLRIELQNERENLINEEKKFDEFKTKLEIADKQLDFQFEAESNKKAATIWAIITGILISCLLIFLFCSLDSNNNLSDIALNIKKQMSEKGKNIDDITVKTIYFSYYKFLITKIFLYSIFIYAIIFCVKNYNAQMHNKIINMHKGNALKSTLSLLNTAKSDDGNDKLLVQATQAIFSHQQTGYNGKESEPPSPNLVTNVIDAATKKI